MMNPVMLQTEVDTYHNNFINHLPSYVILQLILDCLKAIVIPVVGILFLL
jgi:hypothetical protein